MTAPGGGTGYHVSPDSIRASAEFQDGQSERATAIAEQVRSATPQGNLFGLVGQMTGMEQSYRDWVSEQMRALGELTGYLRGVAENLHGNADSYRAVEEHNDTQIRASYQEGGS